MKKRCPRYDAFQCRVRLQGSERVNNEAVRLPKRGLLHIGTVISGEVASLGLRESRATA